MPGLITLDDLPPLASSFNSLFEMPGGSVADIPRWQREDLSILYLRCSMRVSKSATAASAADFQFSIWDARLRAAYGRPLPRRRFQFSIWDAPRYAVLQRRRQRILFQFSIWDAELLDQRRLRRIRSFNSLFEMQKIVKPKKTSKKKKATFNSLFEMPEQGGRPHLPHSRRRNFQFSIWDALIRPVDTNHIWWKKSQRSLSILYLRCRIAMEKPAISCRGTAAPLSILYLRCAVDALEDVCIFGVDFFQFSIWDATATVFLATSSSPPLFQFSIWDARRLENKWSQERKKLLSILYLRCTSRAPSSGSPRCAGSFQFSIWDASMTTTPPSPPFPRRLSILYLRCASKACVLTMISSWINLSILYLRCVARRRARGGAAHPPAFNSLFEMQRKTACRPACANGRLSILYLRCTSERWYPTCCFLLNFQFSIWDATFAGAEAGALAKMEKSFNSLFEMR